MKMKKLEKLLVFILLLALMVVPITGVYATNGTQGTQGKDNGVFLESKSISDPGLPSASSDQIAGYAERKGFEVVNILQRFAEPFMVIIFIIGAFMFLVGLATKGPSARAGLMMMIFSCICYVAIKYAPVIMDAFTSWAKS